MSRRKFDDSSHESDQCYRRKRSRPICYTSDDSISEQEYSIDNSCVRLSNLHLSPNTMLQETEWQTIPTTQAEEEVAEPDRGQDAELLMENINCNDPFEIYELFVTDSIILLMVQQTNKYAIQIGTDNKTKKHQSSWTPVSIGEMKAFLGILLIMGVVQMPDIRLYWAENSIYGNDRIKRIMKRDRFLSILKHLHFADNETCRVEDPLYKIRDFMKEILLAFKSTVTPGKTVVIDESMILWRGRLRFRQYIKGKRHKYGIKLYKLCLPNGYTYGLDVYSGKSSITSTNGHSYDVVEKLMNGLLFEDRIVYTDSYYTSVPLAKSLLQRRTYFCGTVQQIRKFLPVEAKKKQQRGEILAMENSSGIKFVKWTDKRTVSMLTTCKNHKCILFEGKQGKMKPDLVFDYNNAKKGVDLSDQMASYYSCLRKTVKWYRKIAIQLLCGTAIVNAYNIHKTWGSGQMSILKFREKIIHKLLITEEISVRQIKDSNLHFINRYPGIARNVRKRCRECYR
nr:piggyBac transposable element-derived protein 4-like [Megalopta genalis]